MADNTESDAYGDFEELNEEGETVQTEEVVTRVRTPRNKELLGKVSQRLGGNRMEILCSDGKTRNCRVPGRFRRSMWLRPGNLVLIEPWPDDNEKGEIIFQYKPNAISQLKKRGMLNFLNDGF